MRNCRIRPPAIEETAQYSKPFALDRFDWRGETDADTREKPGPERPALNSSSSSMGTPSCRAACLKVPESQARAASARKNGIFGCELKSKPVESRAPELRVRLFSTPRLRNTDADPERTRRAQSSARMKGRPPLTILWATRMRWLKSAGRRPSRRVRPSATDFESPRRGRFARAQLPSAMAAGRGHEP